MLCHVGKPKQQKVTKVVTLCKNHRKNHGSVFIYLIVSKKRRGGANIIKCDQAAEQELHCHSASSCLALSELQIRRGNRDKFGIMFLIFSIETYIVTPH